MLHGLWRAMLELECTDSGARVRVPARVHLRALPAPHNHGVGRLAAVAEAARLVHGALAADGAGQLLDLRKHALRASIQAGAGVADVNLGHVFFAAAPSAQYGTQGLRLGSKPQTRQILWSPYEHV